MKLHEYDKKLKKDKEFQKAYSKIKEGRDLRYNVSHLITEVRRIAGLTQEELAKRIGTKQPAIARVENGSTLPNVKFLHRIAEALNINLIIKWSVDYIGEGFTANAHNTGDSLSVN